MAERLERYDRAEFGGAGGIRTPDLLDAIEARCQLRYGPTVEGIHFIASSVRRSK
jgi:hypothetical protein